MSGDNNLRAKPDAVLVEIAEYVTSPLEASDLAKETAHHCLLDSIACGLMALQYPACSKLLGPIVPGADMPGKGARVFGTGYELDPVRAAFNMGAMIRWLDFNDTWLAAEWGHPSDNLAAILAVADYLGRSSGKNMSLAELHEWMTKAHEVQGVLALSNSFNQVGLDHVLLVRVASTAVCAAMMGMEKSQVIDALSHAWADGGALRTYRHAPNTGSRKSWAAGDAAARAVELCLLVDRGEMGIPTVLSADSWGYRDVLFGGDQIDLCQPLGCYVMENILFKISFPAEFHAQTAVECSFALHDLLKDRIEEIERIELKTQQSAVRIINKVGPLHNPADRDHSLQYMVAIGLLFGELTAKHYEDDVAANPQIDQLRELMTVSEDPQYTVDYLDADKRSIANAIQVFFKDGSCTEKVEIFYPVGHRRRREEGIPLLLEKFSQAISTHYKKDFAENVEQKLLQTDRASFGVLELMNLLQ